MATARAAELRPLSCSEPNNEIPGQKRETVNTYAVLDTLEATLGQRLAARRSQRGCSRNAVAEREGIARQRDYAYLPIRRSWPRIPR